jgi:hypothetical protein
MSNITKEPLTFAEHKEITGCDCDVLQRHGLGKTEFTHARGTAVQPARQSESTRQLTAGPNNRRSGEQRPSKRVAESDSPNSANGLR